MTDPDPKTARILDAALPVFCQYGYRKTSMQDIATAAGMSRAALYLRFTNKDDIFRAGSIRAHTEVAAAIATALDGSSSTGDPFDRIHAALTAFASGLMSEIAMSPHGAELFDASLELVGDVVRDARASLASQIASTLRDAERAGAISLAAVGATPDSLATLLLATNDGMKHAAPGSDLSSEDGLALQLRLIRRSVTIEAT